MADVTVDVATEIPVPFGDLVAFREFFRAVNTTQGLALAGLCDARVELWHLRKMAREAVVPEAPEAAVAPAGNRHARRAAGKSRG